MPGPAHSPGRCIEPIDRPHDGLEQKTERRTTNLRVGGNSRIDVEKELSPHWEDARAGRLGAKFF